MLLPKKEKKWLVGKFLNYVSTIFVTAIIYDYIIKYDTNYT